MLLICANACVVLIVLGRHNCAADQYGTSGISTEHSLMVPVGFCYSFGHWEGQYGSGCVKHE